MIVRAKSYSRVYGDENPVFELDLSGSSLEGVPELLCTANATSPVGTYTIEVRKGTIKNEDVLFENGSLTITKAPLTISLGNYTKKNRPNPIQIQDSHPYQNPKYWAAFILLDALN